MPLFDNPVEALAALPIFALPLIVLISAALEYIVPPYWGDSAILLGFFLAGQNVSSPSLIFAAALVGSCLGSWAAYRLGQRFGSAVSRWLTWRRQPKAWAMLEKRFERFGEGVLIVNRFVPVLRGFFLYGAGAAGLRFKRSMFYAFLSNLGWTLLLMSAGLITGSSWPQLTARFEQYSRVTALVAVGLLVGWLGFALWRARARVLASDALAVDSISADDPV